MEVTAQCDSGARVTKADAECRAVWKRDHKEELAGRRIGDEGVTLEVNGALAPYCRRQSTE